MVTFTELEPWKVPIGLLLACYKFKAASKIDVGDFVNVDEAGRIYAVPKNKTFDDFTGIACTAASRRGAFVWVEMK